MSWADMRHDLGEFLPDMSLWERFKTWVEFYWWPTRRWMPKVSMWWAYKVLRYPPPPPLVKDRIALHHGFVDGVPPCTDGPVCAAHGWPLSPLLNVDRPSVPPAHTQHSGGAS